MSTDERLYRFACQHLDKVKKYKDAIPPIEELSHTDLILAAVVVFYRQNASAQATVDGMQKLGVSLDEIEKAIAQITSHYAGLN